VPSPATDALVEPPSLEVDPSIPTVRSRTIINTSPTTSLRERMIEDMKLHQLLRTTQHNYLRDVTRFAIWLGRPSDTATDEDLRRYQI
jgi:hypothetical protein